ncbi:G-patch domain protein, putative [Paecilomyces variotii No. 5]|uniref:G-patch domain protein, putative n=1 Tax=Byssochlamys spectabilis (strain No. 5 / NBRC 109023) TaxID=1356009 RepID=V5FJX3_BYSSN|nr:G-patch domain protein, putative [Paecilomyces variotii No. 5]
MSHEDDDYFLPLEDQRVFGAGIRRKRVQFVPSAEKTLNTTDVSNAQGTRQTSEPAASIADRYLSIVLPKEAQTPPKPEDRQSEEPEDALRSSAPPSLPATTNTSSSPKEPASAPETTERCEVCYLPLVSAVSRTASSSDGTKILPHEASLAHQLCLSHSHPPSHLDRTRHGLRYLESYGWDPDSRVGLGAPGREGIREPIKSRVKNDTVGLGVKIDPIKAKAAVKEAKVQKLNAKEVRKMEMEGKKKRERLQEMFYRNEDIERYLGGGESVQGLR